MSQCVTVREDKLTKKITVSGVFADPDLAARVVNVYLEELQKFINANAFTSAKRNRIFIEEQLRENKRGFLEAGKEINEFYKRNDISSVEANVDVDVGGLIEGKEGMASGIAKLAQLDVASTGQVKVDVDSLMSQKAGIDAKLERASVVEDVPQQVYLTYLMLRRELLAKVNALLATQYEIAKIDETKEELSFEIIDKGVPAVHKFKPKRALICIAVFMSALFFAVFLAFFRDYLDRMRVLHQ